MSCKIRLALIVTILSVIVCNGEQLLPPNRPPRRFKNDQQAILTIPAHATNLEIVIAANALPITKFAAQELQTHLQKGLNTTIPLVNAPTPDKISFIIGINAFSRQAQLDEKKLCRDAFVIRRLGRKIYIYGKDAPLVNAIAGPNKGPAVSTEVALKQGYWKLFNERASLYGVYEFLERFAGVRFYFPNKYGVIIPQHKELALPGIDIFDRPDTITREFGGIYKGAWDDVPIRPQQDIFYGYYDSPQRNLAAYRWRTASIKIPNMHGLTLLQLTQRFAQTHPEYFALRKDGKRYKEKYMRAAPQFCLCSNLQQEIVADAKAFFTGQTPQSRGINAPSWSPYGFQDGYFNVSLPDAHYPCCCDKCRKFYPQDNNQTRSNHIWRFVAGIANQLKQAKIPGTITMAAYTSSDLVPEVELPDNIQVELSVNGPYNVKNPQAGTFSGVNQFDLIKQWSRKVPGHTVSLYSYAAKYIGTRIAAVPNLAHRSYGKFYTQAGPYLHGAFIEASTDNYLFNYLNAYIFSKALWNTSCDYNAILQDHHRAMFGPAAAVMGKLYDDMEDIWVDKIASRIVHTALGPKPIAPSELEVWTQIYTPALLADFSRRYDTAEKLAADTPDALSRIRYIRKNFLTPMLKRSRKYLAQSSQVSGFTANLPRAISGQAEINIDGKLDEKIWQKALKLKLQATKRLPQGQYPDTFFYILEDQRHLYIAAECFEANPQIYERAARRQRDDTAIWQDNSVEIFLNPNADRKNYYQLMFNSQGALSDQSCQRMGFSYIGNWKWNAQLRHAVHRTPEKWVLEVALDKKCLPGIDGAKICANFVRTRPAKVEECYTWSPFRKKGNHDIDGFGLLLRQDARHNLVHNSNFSEAQITTGYNTFDAGPWFWSRKTMLNRAAFDPNYFINGTQSLRIKSDSTQQVLSVAQRVPEVKPNTRYRLSYYIKLEGVLPLRANCGAKVWFGTGKTNIWFPWCGFIGTRDWFRQSFEFKTPPDTIKKWAALIVGMTYSSGTVWFDDIRLEEIEATPKN